MLAPTTSRVENNSSEKINLTFQQDIKERINRYKGASPIAIDQRLDKLDREINIERAIELEAPMMIGLGVVLAALQDKRWAMLSAFAASMVIFHNLQGWYPLLPIFRRMGIRTQNEVEQEREALRILRGDHKKYFKH